MFRVKLAIFLLHIFLLTTNKIFSSSNELPIVVIIPSYNNADWYQHNLDSVFMQKYKNYRVIYIDDCSTDNTYQLVKNYIETHGIAEHITVIKNKERRGSLYNHFNAVHTCADHEIIVQLDGDDWFAHDTVLSIINDTYQNHDIWLTYGQYKVYPTGKLGLCALVPEEIIEMHAYREYYWVTSALRTFYAWLFKKIKLSDLINEDSFFTAGGDVACMYPMLEMAAGRIKFIDEILYIYNCATPYNDHKTHILNQLNAEYISRGRKKYEPLQMQPKRDRNCTSDCIILSRDNPLGLLILLQSIKKNVFSYEQIYVFYEMKNEENNRLYKECSELFTDVSFVAVDSINFKKNILSILADKNSPYVTFVTDCMMITQPIDLNLCITSLEKTHAYAFFLSLGKNIIRSESIEGIQQQPLFVKVEDNLFAWQFSRAEGDWKHYNNFDLTLYKKSMLYGQLKKIHFDSIKTLDQRWIYSLLDSSSMGLCYGTSSAVRFKSQKNKTIKAALFDKLIRTPFDFLQFRQNGSILVEFPLGFFLNGLS